jgi:hypothetical protein
MRCVTPGAASTTAGAAHRGMKKTLAMVAGARPNFMKIAPMVRALH